MPGSVGCRLDGLSARRQLSAVTVGLLAKLANVNDHIIDTLESGGSAHEATCQKILDALIPAITLTTSTAANPCVVTCTNHGLQTGDVVTIAGHSGTTPTINGARTVTRVNANTFSVGVDTSGGGTGSGGTATPTLASLTVARLNG